MCTLPEMCLNMDVELENRANETLPVVSTIRFHAADVKSKGDYHVNLSVL